MRFKSKKSGFTSLPNHVIQGFYLSTDAIAVLITCLSYPEDWKYRPITIWQNLKIGQKRTYEVFNELIKAGHCVRIRRKNDKTGNGNLAGEIDYIFYDDPKLCSEHLASDCDEFKDRVHSVDFREEFKKCFRHGTGCHAGGCDVQQGENSGIYTYKTNKISIKEDHHHHSISSSSIESPIPQNDDDDSKKEKAKEQNVEVTNTKGENMEMSLEEIYEKLPRFDRSIIKEAIEKMNSMKTPISNIVRYLEATCASIESKRLHEGKQEIKESIDHMDETEKQTIRRNDAAAYCKKCAQTDKTPVCSTTNIEFRHSGVKIYFTDPNFKKMSYEQSASYKDYVEKYSRRPQISNTVAQMDLVDS